jgi:hypothetical protein
MSKSLYQNEPSSAIPSSGPEQVEELVSVIAEVRPHHDSGSKVQAFADVTLSFRSGSLIAISGFSIVHESGKPPVALAPARKGSHRFFPIVSLKGELWRRVEQNILAEYDRVRTTE